MKRIHLVVLLTSVACAVSFAFSPGAGAEEPRLSKGETIYVSVYSNVFTGPKARPLDLSTILSIRNTDMKASLIVDAIDYYDTGGKLLRRHLASPETLNPLATKYIHIGESESAGGPGSNFIVKWHSGKPMNPPIVETVMLGTRGGQGISFVTPGRAIRE
jgi:hypothetical protein